MAEADRFDPPISFTAPGMPAPIVLSTESELDSFITEERNTWQEFLGKVPQTHQAIAQARTNLQNWLQGLSANLNGLRAQQGNPTQRVNGITGMRNALLQIQQGQALYSKSPAAVALFELAKHDLQAAGIRLARLLGQAGLAPQGQINITLVRSIITDQLSEADIREAIRMQNQLLDAQRSQFNTIVDTARNQFSQQQAHFSATTTTANDAFTRLEAHGKELTAEIDKTIAGSKSDVEKHLLELHGNIAAAATALTSDVSEIKKKTEDENLQFQALLRAQLRLQAPTTYWRTRAKQADKASYCWLLAFGVAAAVLILGIAFGASKLLHEIATDSGGNLYIGDIVVFTIPALAYFWFLRYLGRFFSSNHAAARDAHLRAIMTETFLALGADGRSGIGDAERLIILQALFRPANDKNEDAPPPNLLEIMTRVVSGDKTAP